MKPHTHLAVRAALTAAGVTAFVVGARMAYENAETTRETGSVIAAGVGACTLLATFSLLLSAALSYGWEHGRAKAAARFETRLNTERPIGPHRGYGYRVKDDEPNEVFETEGGWRPTEAAGQAAGTGPEAAGQAAGTGPEAWLGRVNHWAQQAAEDAVDEAEQVAA